MCSALQCKHKIHVYVKKHRKGTKKQNMSGTKKSAIALKYIDSIKKQEKKE